MHAAQGYTTHRKLGGRSGRRGPAPTTLGTPAPPTAAPPAPRAHSRVVPTPAHTPRVRGGPFGRVLGGPIFRLPLRFIGAAAVGRSSEEAGASSGWLGALVFSGDTQSRRHRGAGCVRWLAPRGARWLAGSLAPGCGAAAGADPCPGAGRRRAAGSTALRVSAPHSHVSPGAPWLPAKCEARASSARTGTGQGRPGTAALPRASRAPSNSLFSLFSIGVPTSQAKARRRAAASSCHRASALFFFELFDISRCFLVCSRPFFVCSSFLALSVRRPAQQPEAGQPRSAAPGQRGGHHSGVPRHGAHGGPSGRGRGQAGRPEVAEPPC